jgi:hypothetical protein
VIIVRGNIVHNVRLIINVIYLLIGILYYLSATVNPVLYNIMSKRYRNSFKRTLCRWKIFSRKSSYQNGRSYIYSNQHCPRSPMLSYRINPSPKKVSNNKSYNHYHDNLFTFSMSKYKFVIGSRRFSRQNLQGDYQRRRSFHYRLSLVEKKERQEENEKMKLELKQRKFSFHFIQQPKRHRAKFVFTTNLTPLTPPNSSITDSKSITQKLY